MGGSAVSAGDSGVASTTPSSSTLTPTTNHLNTPPVTLSTSNSNVKILPKVVIPASAVLDEPHNDLSGSFIETMAKVGVDNISEVSSDTNVGVTEENKVISDSLHTSYTGFCFHPVHFVFEINVAVLMSF